MRIQISDGGMTATAVAVAGLAMSGDELAAELANARVVHGLVAEAIADLARQLADPSFAGSRVVARGEPAQPGTDGRLDGVPAHDVLPGSPRTDSSIDYRERRFLVPITAEQALGNLVAPTAGNAGRDVAGNVVAARPGKPLALRIGPGARQDGERLVATRAGVLLRDARQIDVLPLYVHADAVDYASGSLHSDGSLEVRGDVTPGFTVAAAGDVLVRGAVFDGTVTAGHDVHIDQGLLGTAARVQASGDVFCRHATAATLQTEGAVVFGDQAAHCRVRANTIAARSGRGTVVGGDLRARRSIVVRHAGTPVGARTLLAVGDLLDVAASAVAATNLDSKVAERARQRSGGDRGKALRSTLRADDARRQEELQLRLRQRELLADAFVEVHETVHPGVRITFGERTWTTEVPRQGLRLRWADATGTVIEENLP